MGAERLRAHLRRSAATRRAAADLLGRPRVFPAGRHDRPGAHGRRVARPHAGRAARAGPTPPAAAIADNANQKEEQTMTLYDYLMKAVQDDARRRRTRPAAPRGTAGSQGAPSASGSRCSSEAPNRNGKARRERARHAQRSHPRPAGDEGFRAGGWVGLIGNSPGAHQARLAPSANQFLRHWPWNRHPHPANMAG